MKWRDVTPGAARLEDLRKADPYAVLGVERGADLAAIKQAYRMKVRTYHPDKADAFLRAHCDEMLKIINRAMARIEAEVAHADRG
jgi:curved DNA-binding protein CbpA